MKKILVYLEQENSNIKDVSFQLISKAKELTSQYEDFEIIGIVISKNQIDENIFYTSGLKRVIICETPNLAEYSAIEYSNIFCEIIEKEQPEIIFIGATNQGRDLAPRISAKIKTGLTADCTQLEIDVQGKLTATRPTFGGSLMAQIWCKTLPQMATVRPGIFKQKKFEYFSDLKIEKSKFDCFSQIEILKKLSQNENFCSFVGSKIILAGGAGLKNKENFELLKQLANKISAKVGASRKAVEKGLIEKKYQIGQTGQTVAPHIYIAIGISGAIQHISGIENSQTIIAINPDRDAPIHDVADYSIFMDAQTFITDFINQL